MYGPLVCPGCGSERTATTSTEIVYGCGTRVVAEDRDTSTIRSITCLRAFRRGVPGQVRKKSARRRRVAKAPDGPTHADLVKTAAKWLMNRKGCSIVVTELYSYAAEQPDALGYRYGMPLLVECKTSVSDFKADSRKSFRINPDKGMGYYRWYMAPHDVAEKIREELPERWGLLSVKGNGVSEVVKSGRFPTSDHRSEITMLGSLVRRIGSTAPEGVSIKCYTHQTKCKAELHVEELDEQPRKLDTGKAAFSYFDREGNEYRSSSDVPVEDWP